jgi:hypothetical protein
VSTHRFQISIARERVIGEGITENVSIKQMAIGKLIKKWDEVALISNTSWDSPFHARKAALKSLLYETLAKLEGGELDRLMLDEHEYERGSKE